ncbi:unc-50 family protein [Aspergillus saccharolyticus JOP 1030-1]|uniref:Integral membrane protein n=1 Tax=Aspergillus saccharolyticus JOP 1030-1 TaxID=1450539 RepID=A0A318Z8M4_9EURO|nr:integral membrane protein [Aspergillus saccharolyticus JOP 1030-1]PYH41123.1 integral membrane protein [Aspergillus saccharolyticus JOP 1030-1]
MNPHISVPRQHASPSNFGGTAPASRRSSLRMPRFFKRLFKFPQMDFEMAIWEMTSLLIAPKKVFKSIYYHHFHSVRSRWETDCPPETKNTWHRPDPSFTYLLSFFLLLTALAWGLAYAPSFGSIVRLSFIFVFIHFIGSSLLVSTLGYLVVPRIFGPEGAAASFAGFRGSRGRRRGAAQGLFSQPGEKDQLEFGYCFDVSNRAFFPLYLHLYVVQFLLLPLLTRNPSNFLATFLGNTLYLSAITYYTYITFLGYNALPFLHNTELLLLPILAFAIFWLVSLVAGWGLVMQGRSVEWLVWGA